MNLHERRQAEFEKYRRVYRDYPRYRNRENRIELTREWAESHPEAKSLLDVGAGRGEVVRMARALGLEAIGAEVLVELCRGDDVEWIPGAHDLMRSGSASWDLVTCTDVMEHILEEDVPAALSELARVARGPVLLTICHRPDTPGKYGPDTLHITLHSRAWWEQKIRENMDPVSVQAIYDDRVNNNGTWFSVRCG